MILLILLLKIQYEALCQAISVIGLVVKFSVATSAASGSPGFDSLITQGYYSFVFLTFFWRFTRLAGPLGELSTGVRES